MSTNLALAAAGILSVVLRVGQALIVLIGFAGSQLGRIGGLGCYTGLGVGVGPGVLLALQQCVMLSTSSMGQVCQHAGVSASRCEKLDRLPRSITGDNSVLHG